jgi:hypothetical protein
MDSKTLLYLLKGGHINMEMRLQKKLWPHPPIPMSQCIKEVVACLKAEKYFPHPWMPRKNGELIDDSSALELINDKKIMYRARAASPSDLTRITAQTEKNFSSAEIAVDYYLRNTLYIPGDLDGWEVIEG